jgi:hypothetical protein
MGSCELLPRLASNLDPPDLSLSNSWNYRREPPEPGNLTILEKETLKSISSLTETFQKVVFAL